MPHSLITGGSKGFGRALALDLAADGWNVVITSRNPVDLEVVAQQGQGRIRTVAGSIRDDEHRRALARIVGGELDLLVNNASALGASPLLPISAFSDGQLHEVFDTNVVAPLALTALLLPALRVSGGVVVNVSSDAAAEAYETWGPYGASKAALDHASAVLGEEEQGVRVLAFDPGDMRTEMHQAAFPGEDISDRPLPETVVPVLRDLVSSDRPSGRYAAGDLVVGAR